jgi:signal transduction histidine kinase
MTSIRSRLLLVFTALFGVATLIMYYGLNQSKIEQITDYEISKMDAQSQIIRKNWQVQGGCNALPHTTDFSNYDSIYLQDTGLAYRISCEENNYFQQSTGFPELDYSELSIEVLLSADDATWVITKYEIRGGSLIIAQKESSEWGNYYTIRGFTIALLASILVILLGILYYLIGTVLTPIRSLTDAAIDGDQTLGQYKAPSELDPLRALLLKMQLSTQQIKADNAMLISNERRFTANAAHELLTPLAAIKAEVQLQQRISKSKKLQAWLSELSLRVNRATHTVDQLITLSRLEPGHEPKNQSPINMNILINDILGDMGEEIKAKKLALSTSISDAAIIVGNPQLMNIMLRNLIKNAVLYTPISGNIVLQSADKDGHTNLTITNDCKELPEYFTEHIFERFVRGPHESETGSGLGLAIAQKIAQAHNTNVEIEVAADRKTVSFMVTFISMSED